MTDREQAARFILSCRNRDGSPRQDRNPYWTPAQVQRQVRRRWPTVTLVGAYGMATYLQWVDEIDRVARGVA